MKIRALLLILLISCCDPAAKMKRTTRELNELSYDIHARLKTRRQLATYITDGDETINELMKLSTEVEGELSRKVLAERVSELVRLNQDNKERFKNNEKEIDELLLKIQKSMNKAESLRSVNRKREWNILSVDSVQQKN